MVGAYFAVTVSAYTGSLIIGLVGGLLALALVAALVEFTLTRRLYSRDHLDQVL